MSCDDVDLILAVGAASGGVALDELEQVRTHIAGCARCARAAAEYTAVADLLAVAVEPVEPPATLRSRIMGEVYREVGQAPAVAQAGQARRSLAARLWGAIPQARSLTALGAAAGLAAVALLVWTLGPGRSSGTSPAPGAVTAAVHGTVADPSVQGTLTYYPQTQTAVLSVQGLHKPAGQVVEVWLIRPDNRVTAAGYLTQQPDGTWSAAMHGSMRGYTGVAATLEPTDGSPTPTGPQVLSGSVPSTP